MSARRALALAMAMAASGCSCEATFLQRMKQQPKVLPYGESHFYPDGRAMREPPEGTVAREWAKYLSPLGTGKDARGEYVRRSPLPLTRALLERGQSRFDITCAACHGLLGDGSSLVAENMSQRRPPSLYPFMDRPDGMLFDVITQGYGVMPSYAPQLTPEDRWAVIAYMRVLSSSQQRRLDQLPPAERDRLKAHEDAR